MVTISYRTDLERGPSGGLTSPGGRHSFCDGGEDVKTVWRSDLLKLILGIRKRLWEDAMYLPAEMGLGTSC